MPNPACAVRATSASAACPPHAVRAARHRALRTSLSALTACVALTLAGSAFAQAPAAANKPIRIRGEIVSLSGDTLVVHRRSGDTVSVALQPETQVAALKNIQLSDIKPGSFVGTTAMTGTDGKMTATEVHVFAESARGAGEGHYAWDLGANSTMTNANVDTVVKSTDGRVLTLSYKGGSSTITVPEKTPVVTFISAARTDLLPGKKVLVLGTQAGANTYTGQRVLVEKDGVVPPM